MTLHRSWLLAAMAAITLARPGTAQDAAPSRVIDSVALRTLHVPGAGDFLVADGRSVWLTNEDRLERWTPTGSRPAAVVALGEPCGAPVLAFGSVWVADCARHAIQRISRSTAKVVATIPVSLADPSGELSLAAGAGSIWVLSDSAGILTRIDARTNAIAAKIRVAPGSYAAVFGFGSVWVTTTDPASGSDSGSVHRINPGSNTVVASIRTGPKPRFLAAGEGAVWTLNQGDGTVTRVDPRHNRVAATIDAGVPGTFGDIATGLGRVWVRATRVLLTAIDPATDRVAERYGPPAGRGAVRVAQDLVWVSAHDIQRVWVLRPNQRPGR